MYLLSIRYEKSSDNENCCSFGTLLINLLAFVGTPIDLQLHRNSTTQAFHLEYLQAGSEGIMCGIGSDARPSIISGQSDPS